MVFSESGTISESRVLVASEPNLHRKPRLYRAVGISFDTFLRPSQPVKSSSESHTSRRVTREEDTDTTTSATSDHRSFSERDNATESLLALRYYLEHVLSDVCTKHNVTETCPKNFSKDSYGYLKKISSREPKFRQEIRNDWFDESHIEGTHGYSYFTKTIGKNSESSRLSTRTGHRRTSGVTPTKTKSTLPSSFSYSPTTNEVLPEESCQTSISSWEYGYYETFDIEELLRKLEHLDSKRDHSTESECLTFSSTECFEQQVLDSEEMDDFLFNPNSGRSQSDQSHRKGIHSQHAYKIPSEKLIEDLIIDDEQSKTNHDSLVLPSHSKLPDLEEQTTYQHKHQGMEMTNDSLYQILYNKRTIHSQDKTYYRPSRETKQDVESSSHQRSAQHPPISEVEVLSCDGKVTIDTISKTISKQGLGNIKLPFCISNKDTSDVIEYTQSTKCETSKEKYYTFSSSNCNALKHKEMIFKEESSAVTSSSYDSHKEKCITLQDESSTIGSTCCDSHHRKEKCKKAEQQREEIRYLERYVQKTKMKKILKGISDPNQYANNMYYKKMKKILCRMGDLDKCNWHKLWKRHLEHEKRREAFRKAKAEHACKKESVSEREPSIKEEYIVSSTTYMPLEEIEEIEEEIEEVEEGGENEEVTKLLKEEDSCSLLFNKKVCISIASILHMEASSRKCSH